MIAHRLKRALEGFVILLSLFEPAAAGEELIQELHGVHIIKVRVRAEVAGGVLVALIFLGFEFARVPEAVVVISETW